MSIFRDAYGIPHIRAGSVTEVGWLQGWATARDRAWQLEIERLRGEGRTAELLGPAGVEWDVFARRARLAVIARAGYDRLDEETRAFVAAYAAGVTAGLPDASSPELDELGPAPGDWQPWTPLAVFLVQQVLFGTFPGKLFRARAREVLGEQADLFRTEGLAGGSNAYAVGGARTTSGGPIVAGDPHRLFEAPNIYQQVRLACTDDETGFDVLGLTFPGVPGIQHFGHTGNVAWAVTNAMADYQDLHRVDLARDGSAVHSPDGPITRSVETVLVRGAAPVEVEVLVTGRGPVIDGGPDDGSGLVLQSPSHDLGDLGFGALLPLVRARTVADVEDALRCWVEPVNNWVVADTSGALLHVVAGRCPVRADGAWAGWIDPLPRRTAGPGGYLVTANDRCTPEHGVLAADFAPPFRAERIATLLESSGPLDSEDAVAVLADLAQTAGTALLALVPSELRPAWDGAMDGSPGAAWFAELREEVVTRICAAPALAPLRAPSAHGPLFQPWSDLAGQVATSLHVILAADRPFGLDLAALVEAAATAVAARAQTPWPERHVFHPLHALEQFGLPHRRTTPATPLPGDTDTVRCAAWLPGSTVTVRGSVARYAWDLADRDHSRWVVPLGASGDPASPHHTDQHDTWAAGGALPVCTAWDQLTEEHPEPTERTAP
ncbi:MAG: penicillin acylase family protein [Dermatophilaceae bacterium]